MRLRLFLSFAFIVLVSVITVVVIARHNAATEVNNFMFRGGMSGINSLVTDLENYYQAHGTWQGAEELINNRRPGQGAGPGGFGRQGSGGAGMMGAFGSQRLRLADAQGNLLIDTGAPQPIGKLSSNEIQSAIPLEVRGSTVGYLLPENSLLFNQADEQALVKRLNQAALTAGLVAGGLSLLLALLLAYRLLRPVRDLTRASQRLAKGDLSQRVQVRGRDELSTLARTFNEMAGSLQRSEEARRAMTADIAHELRNPLAVQRANLEALQDGIYPLTAENLEPILAQNQLLTRLVEDLRTLALAEAGQLHLECVPTDLADLVQRVVERFSAQANLRGVVLETGRESGATPPENPPRLIVDPGRVEQILGNLLSNALRYTPEGGSIKIGLSPLPANGQPQAVLLTVQDSGPGIPQEALPHLFERFYRVDRSRSRLEGGTGLGLAIARQLAEAHGGDLKAANHPQGGAVFTLTLPLERGVLDPRPD